MQSVQRALAILSAFSHEDPALGITELARRVGLTKGVVFRAVKTMLELGFLERDGDAGAYRIGLRAFEVGSLYPLGATLERAALRPMQELASGYGHNVYLGALDGRYVVYLATVDGGAPIKVHVAVGSRAHAHATAMGKVLLAFTAPDEVHRLLTKRALQRLTPRTITDVRRLEGQLRQIRRVGFGVNRGENLAGVGSVSGPIRDRSGKVIAAVSNGFPLHAETRVNWAGMAADVVRCADAISLGLGAVTRRRS